MIKRDLNEAVDVTTTVLNALLLVLQGQTGLAGAQLRFLCGSLVANGATELGAGGMKFWVDLRNCFEAAPLAGATFAAMGNVRTVAEALSPTGLAAVAARNFSVRMALAEQARILAATVFTSRDQIDGYFDEIDAAFDRAELIAADNFDTAAYGALITIHAAVSNDLTNRSFALPTVVTFAFPQRMPSLWHAQRIYADASRNDQLIAQNRPIHPLFMGPVVEALSV
jgi:prophage DNA circulation protein